MGTQDLPEVAYLIYLEEALPEEYRYYLAGLSSVEEAWQRLDHRFGDKQERLRLVYERLVNLGLEGKTLEDIFKAEKTIKRMRTQLKIIDEEYK